MYAPAGLHKKNWVLNLFYSSVVNSVYARKFRQKWLSGKEKFCLRSAMLNNRRGGRSSEEKFSGIYQAGWTCADRTTGRKGLSHGTGESVNQGRGRAGPGNGQLGGASASTATSHRFTPMSGKETFLLPHDPAALGDGALSKAAGGFKVAVSIMI